MPAGSTTLLTLKQLQVAMAYYAKRPALKAEFPEGFAPGVVYGSEAFICAVAEFQAAHGLVIDGKAGEVETLPSLDAAYRRADGRAGVLVCRGREYKIEGVRVVNTRSSEGYDFSRYPGHTHGAMKAGKPAAVVVHDSVTRTTDACFRVLLERKGADKKNLGLGTGLMLSPSGTLYQCVPDLVTITYHAGGGWNGVAIGLDVIALLDPSFAPHSPDRRPPTRWAPQGYLDWTSEQKRAIPLILRCLRPILDLGQELPYPKNGGGKPIYCEAGEKLDLDPKTYRGVVAHGQISSARWDGQLALLYTFDPEGRTRG